MSEQEEERWRGVKDQFFALTSSILTLVRTCTEKKGGSVVPLPSPQEETTTIHPPKSYAEAADPSFVVSCLCVEEFLLFLIGGGSGLLFTVYSVLIHVPIHTRWSAS